MYKKRYQFWSEIKPQDDEFAKLYPTYEKFEQHFFSDENSFVIFFNLLRDNYDFSEEISECYKKFACDLDWAKDTEYCKVASPAKEKNRWYDLEESNKQKFISRYPCIGSLPINYGKQKETDEGLIISLNVIYNNERVWLFMVESQNPDLMSKYHALIKKQDGSDEGRFECENMTQPQDNQLSPD